MRTMILAALVALAAGLATACYTTPKPDCSFLCGPAGDCPSGYFCATDGICKRDGLADDFECRAHPAIDAATTVDASAIDGPRPDAATPGPDAATPIPDAAIVFDAAPTPDA